MKTKCNIFVVHSCLIFIFLEFYSQDIFSQQTVTIYTPKNESVYATRLTDPDEDYVAYLEYYADSLVEAHPTWDVTRIGPATVEYNCHGYAWHVSDNGTHFVIQSDVEKYWTGMQSYTQTLSQNNGEKVRYTDDDHSAITTTSYDYVVSKWGSLPLYRHKKSDCPYVSTNLAYYKLNPSVSGSTDLLCVNDQRSYYTDITNMPGSTLTWTKGSNLEVIGDSDTAQYTIRGTGNGNTYVNIEISTPTGFYWSSGKQFHVGPYSSSDYEITGPSSAPCKSYVYYSIPSLIGTTSINWTWPSSWTYISGQNTTSLALRTGNYSGTVTVCVNNTCGQCGSYDTQYTSVYGYCGYSMLITPNPANDEVNITIKEPETTQADSISSASEAITINENYKILITDKFGVKYNEIETSAISFNLNIQHLKKGSYIITAFKGQIQFSSYLIVN